MAGSKATRAVLTALSAVVSFALIALFVRMLPFIGVTVGSAAGEKRQERTALELSDTYRRYIGNLSASAMEGIIPIPKSYQLPEDTVIAPKPDPANFGSSESTARSFSV